jgi:hypothetical protein
MEQQGYQTVSRLRLGPLYHFCIPSFSTVSPRPFVVSEFLVQSFLKKLSLRHAILARRDAFMQAAADILLDTVFLRVLSFRFWWRSAARLQTLRRFLGSPTGITEASPLGFPDAPLWAA